MRIGFDFGSNWKRFATYQLTTARVEDAFSTFQQLTDGIDLESASVLDVGFGQGLSALCAARLGANVVCLDLDSECAEALELTSRFFAPEVRQRLKVEIGSIVSDSMLRTLERNQPGGYDVVHSWGVLHHTGQLEQAFANCVSLVRPGGFLIVAIYNHHWSSRAWVHIKRMYCRLPSLGQKMLVALFVPVIFSAKLLATRKNPLRKDRGMDFIVDIVDWVGGYPYEYASVKEICELGAARGLYPLRVNPAEVPTGCNEFVFVKSDDSVVKVIEKK